MKKNLILILCLVLAMSLCACGAQPAPEEDTVPVDTADIMGLPEYSELAGEYGDSFSMRASATVTEITDGVSIEVWWGSSAEEMYYWTLTAGYDADGRLAYEDCAQSIINTSEEGENDVTVVYTDGSGYFDVVDGMLMWTGAADESCQECSFVKIPEE